MGASALRQKNIERIAPSVSDAMDALIERERKALITLGSDPEFAKRWYPSNWLANKLYREHVSALRKGGVQKASADD